MKSSKKGLLIFIVILLVAVVGIGAYLYLETDLFAQKMSLKDKFFTKAMSVDVKELVKEANFAEDYMKKFQENNFEMNTELTVNLNGEIANQLAGLDLSKFKINVDTKRDVKNAKTYNDIKLSYLENELFDIVAANDKDVYALKSEEIVKDRYLGCNKNNFITLLNRLGLEIDGESLNLEELENVANNLDTEKYKNLLTAENLTKYKDVVLNNLTEANFVEEANKTIQTKFGTKTATAIGLTLKESEVQNITKQLLTVLKEDTALLNALVEIMKNSDPTVTIGDLQTEIQDAIDSIGLESENTSINTNSMDTTETEIESTLNIVLYVENDKVVKMVVSLNGETSIIFDLDFDLNAGNNKVNVNLTTKEEESEASVVVYFERQVTESYDKAKCEMTFLEDKETLFSVVANASQTLVSANSYENDVSASLTIDGSTIGFNVENKVDFVDEVQIDNLTSENTTMFDEMSDDVFNNTVAQIMVQAQNVFVQKVQDLMLIRSNTSSGMIDQPNN